MKVSDYASHASKSFALPDICVRIRKMLDDDSSDIDDISAVVSLDPSLTSKLLKLANSPLFRFRSQVDSIAKAVNVIGGEALYNLVMAETASSAFSHFSVDGFDIDRFWSQSLYGALVAKDLAKLARVRGSEKFFLLGLMHNIGELVVASRSPDKAEQCLSFDKQMTPWRLQKKVLGFHYTDCSAEIMRDWMLPDQLCYLIQHANDTEKAICNKEMAIVFMSCRIALAMVNEHLYQPERLIDPVLLESAGLEPEHLQDAIRFSRLEAGKMLAIMNPRLAA